MSPRESIESSRSEVLSLAKILVRDGVWEMKVQPNQPVWLRVFMQEEGKIAPVKMPFGGTTTPLIIQLSKSPDGKKFARARYGATEQDVSHNHFSQDLQAIAARSPGVYDVMYRLQKDADLVFEIIDEPDAAHRRSKE